MTQIAVHHAHAVRLDLPDAVIAALDTGESGGSTAIMVPGYSGSKEDFAPLLDTLARAGHRVVAIDPPGMYQSPGPDDSAAYTTGWLGSIVCEVAKAVDDRPVHLLGHSFGGLIARAAVLSESSRFRSLTLLDSGPSALPDGPRLQLLAALEPLLPQGSAALYAALQQLEAGDPRVALRTPALREFLRERFVASSTAALKGMADALRTEPDQVAELAAAGVPTLVCYGELDDAWAPATQAEMAARLGAEHQVIAGAAHSPAAEKPSELTSVLTRFWADHDR